MKPVTEVNAPFSLVHKIFLNSNTVRNYMLVSVINVR